MRIRSIITAVVTLRKRFLMPRCLRRGWMNHLGEGSMPDAKMN